jgi:hypothetical protein
VPPMVPMLYRPRGRRYRRPGRPATAPALLPYAARLRGAHASGFVLTQGKAAGKCGTATYSLVRTAKAAQSQRSIGIIGTTGIGPDAPYGPYAFPPRSRQELRECSATLERAFADVERADLGPGLFDDFAFLIDLLIAQSAPSVSFSSLNRTWITGTCQFSAGHSRPT